MRAFAYLEPATRGDSARIIGRDLKVEMQPRGRWSLGNHLSRMGPNKLPAVWQTDRPRAVWECGGMQRPDRCRCRLDALAGAALVGAGVAVVVVLAGAGPVAAEEAIAVVALAPGATCCICCSISPTVVPKRLDWSLKTAPLPGPEAVTATRARPVISPGVSVVALTVKVTATNYRPCF